MKKMMPAVFLLLVLIVAALIYAQGLSGPFVFDDGLNIVTNQSLRISDLSMESLLNAAYSVPNGILGRPLSMLSFALNFYIDADYLNPSPSAYSFKAVNIIIHLMNGLAVFFVARRLVSLFAEKSMSGLPRCYPERLALVVAAAWMLHPLNLSAVLYVVQRMASLASFFTLLGLYTYLWGRSRLDDRKFTGMVAIFIAIIFFTPLAALCKETGALLPIYILLAEIILFRFQTSQKLTHHFLILFFGISILIPALIVCGYTIFHPQWLLAGYERRDFDLTERLMTQSRVIWFYMSQIVLPNTSAMGIFHDDFEVSRSLANPLTTITSIVGLLILVGVLWWWRVKYSLASFGVLFFLIGHVLESSVFPLELVHEHRNYLPMIGILLVFFHLIINPLISTTTLRIRYIFAIVLISIFAFGTWSRSTDWSSADKLWAAEVRNHPDSVRANVALGDNYASQLSFDAERRKHHYQFAKEAYEKALLLEKYNPSALFGLLELSRLHAVPIDRIWIDHLVYGLERNAIPSSTNDRLVSISICLIQKDCPYEVKDVRGMLEAPLRNKKVTGRDRALILSARTFYFAKIEKDYQSALTSTIEAISLDSDIVHQMWLLDIYTSSGQMDNARKQLEALRKIDAHNIRAKDIDMLAEKIS